MNSLEELNNYSLNSGIVFEDDRPFGVIATTNGLPATDVDVSYNTAIDFSNYGLTITSIISADDETSDHITLTFDFSDAADPNITWPSATNSVEFSEPSPGVFVASKIQLLSDYNRILSTVEIIANGQLADFEYVVTASWPGVTHAQTFNATVIQITTQNFDVNRNFIENTTSELFVADYPTVTDLIDPLRGLTLYLETDQTGQPLDFNRRFVDINSSTGEETTTPSEIIQFSGTASQINQYLSGSNTTKFAYIPTAGDFTDNTVTWRIEVTDTPGVTVVSGTFEMLGTQRTTSIAGEGVHTFNYTGSAFQPFTITDEMRRYCTFDVLLVGGGGGGGQLGNTSVNRASGDGGAGGILEFRDVPLLDRYTDNPQLRVYVGKGGDVTGVGSNSDPGGDTYIEIDVDQASGVEQWEIPYLARRGGGGVSTPTAGASLGSEGAFGGCGSAEGTSTLSNTGNNQLNVYSNEYSLGVPTIDLHGFIPNNQFTGPAPQGSFVNISGTDYPLGGEHTVPTTASSDITGSTVVYGAAGGVGGRNWVSTGYTLRNPTSGTAGTAIIRITQK